MKLESTIKVHADNKLYACLLPELRDFNAKRRSKVELKKERQMLLIKISADDPVAMKATINSLLQLLIVYEKTGEYHGTERRDKKEDRAAPEV